MAGHANAKSAVSAVSRLGRAVSDSIKGMNSSLAHMSGLQAGRRQRNKPRRKGHSGKGKKTPFKTGQLYRKQQFGFVSWKKEWMVLTNEGLLYFKSEDAQKKADVKGSVVFCL